MLTKSEKTRLFILETVAPIFNRMGYFATSIHDLTEATGLTKGAIYGHFEHKEELAMAAFKFNIKKILSKIEIHLDRGSNPLEKLKLLTDFYRNYTINSIDTGGCPILNMGIDTNHNQLRLFAKVQETIRRMEFNLEALLKDGISQSLIKPDISAELYAKRIYTLLQGAIFMSHTMNNQAYLTDASSQIEDMIENQLKA
ncbi:MAG: TetR/AcrR family transcriptional regulator [Saprospiraceae bacterium]|nr:TetR/AcrR family transcriptional regulator [Saprospiraceae bacterium]